MTDPTHPPAAPSSSPVPEESIESSAETDRCRTIAFAVNDGPLNVQPVSVNQVRHVLRCAARLDAESATIHHTRPALAGDGETPDAWGMVYVVTGQVLGLVAERDRHAYDSATHFAVVPLYRRDTP